ncbi:MAG: hypothetical protein DHS80DRAFT_33276 [Piptocephalis tieghemiana]|nr:MAG: hypothetical protein DHS80DRAFT_33276 [Piptocephalis tieghemiana]
MTLQNPPLHDPSSSSSSSPPLPHSSSSSSSIPLSRKASTALSPSSPPPPSLRSLDHLPFPRLVPPPPPTPHSSSIPPSLQSSPVSSPRVSLPSASSLASAVASSIASASTSLPPSSIPLPVPPTPKRSGKSHVTTACANCKKAHMACDVNRPCRRCVVLGKEATCTDVRHKRRGRPRIRSLGIDRSDGMFITMSMSGPSPSSSSSSSSSPSSSIPIQASTIPIPPIAPASSSSSSSFHPHPHPPSRLGQRERRSTALSFPLTQGMWHQDPPVSIRPPSLVRSRFPGPTVHPHPSIPTTTITVDTPLRLRASGHQRHHRTDPIDPSSSSPPSSSSFSSSHRPRSITHLMPHPDMDLPSVRSRFTEHPPVEMDAPYHPFPVPSRPRFNSHHLHHPLPMVVTTTTTTTTTTTMATTTTLPSHHAREERIPRGLIMGEEEEEEEEEEEKEDQSRHSPMDYCPPISYPPVPLPSYPDPRSYHAPRWYKHSSRSPPQGTRSFRPNQITSHCPDTTLTLPPSSLEPIQTTPTSDPFDSSTQSSLPPPPPSPLPHPPPPPLPISPRVMPLLPPPTSRPSLPYSLPADPVPFPHPHPRYHYPSSSSSSSSSSPRPPSHPPLLLYAHRSNLNILYASEDSLQVLGILPHFLLHHSLHSLLHPQDHPALHRLHQQALSQAPIHPAFPSAMDGLLRCGDGHHHLFRISLHLPSSPPPSHDHHLPFPPDLSPSSLLIIRIRPFRLISPTLTGSRYPPS